MDDQIFGNLWNHVALVAWKIRC